MSSATSEASAFVAAHLEQATALGNDLAELTEEPDAFVQALTEGLTELLDPAYSEAITRACPETPARYAVRGPLSELLQEPVRRALRESSTISAVRLAQRLAETEHRDLRLYALAPLRIALPQDPELCWQLMRRLGRLADDWIAVDSLADVWARGVLAEHFRWSELEQLIYSQHRYERRLVAATLAMLPHRVPKVERGRLRDGSSERATSMLRQLMGDAEVVVQKALSWAIREWTRVDPGRTQELILAEASIAAQDRDGARAWVIRDALTNQKPDLADRVRAELAGIRRDGKAPSTSIAAGHAAGFSAALTGANDAIAAQGDRYTRSRA
jgi:3-methyladenine DNA glycosylase AlkD